MNLKSFPRLTHPLCCACKTMRRHGREFTLVTIPRCFTWEVMYKDGEWIRVVQWPNAGPVCLQRLTPRIPSKEFCDKILGAGKAMVLVFVDDSDDRKLVGEWSGVMIVDEGSRQFPMLRECILKGRTPGWASKERIV